MFVQVDFLFEWLTSKAFSLMCFGGSELCMPVDTKAGFATMRSEDFKQGGVQA